MMNLVTKVPLLLSLVLVWAGLNGLIFKLDKILYLVLIPLISYILACYLSTTTSRCRLKLNFIGYFFWLIKEIMKSTIDVLKIIWRRDMNLDEAMEWIEVSSKDEIFLTIYGNSITLTPGTVTLDVKDNMLLVHGLMRSSVHDLHNGEMETRVKAALLSPVLNQESG